MKTFDTSGLAAGYATLNGSGFSDDVKVLKIYNGSTVAVTVSYDSGVTDQDYFPVGATQILDIQANHANNSAYGSGTLNGRAGQVIMGKGSAGTGSIYIIGYR